MNEPQGKREAHKQQTRAALLRAAERLFDEHGFHATTVAAIAREAGVTERTFFRYFASKDELAQQDMSDWLDIFEAALLAAPSGTPALIALRNAILTALESPGPVAGWLFPTDAEGRVGPKTSATRSMNARVAEIIARSALVGYAELRIGSHRAVGGLKVMDTFHAQLLAVAVTGIVRAAIGAAGQRAALAGGTATLEDISALVGSGFDFLIQSAGATGVPGE